MKNTILDQLKQDERAITAWLLNKEPPADPDRWQQVVEGAFIRSKVWI